MAEIECYGVIDDHWVRGLKDAIASVPPHEPIELRVSSPGGYLGYGISAYNLLSRAKNEVIATLDGDAFSAATVLLCAADHVEMPSNCLMMIHDPWIPKISPATIAEVEKSHRYLQASKAQCLDIYEHRTQKSKEVIGNMMAAETYFTAREALEFGLATNVLGPVSEVRNLALDQMFVLNHEKLAKAMANRQRDVRQIAAKYGVNLG